MDNRLWRLPQTDYSACGCARDQGPSHIVVEREGVQSLECLPGCNVGCAVDALAPPAASLLKTLAMCLQGNEHLLCEVRTANHHHATFAHCLTPCSAAAYPIIARSLAHAAYPKSSLTGAAVTSSFNALHPVIRLPRKALWQCTVGHIGTASHQFRVSDRVSMHLTPWELVRHSRIVSCCMALHAYQLPNIELCNTVLLAIPAQIALLAQGALSAPGALGIESGSSVVQLLHVWHRRHIARPLWQGLPLGCRQPARVTLTVNKRSSLTCSRLRQRLRLLEGSKQIAQDSTLSNSATRLFVRLRHVRVRWMREMPSLSGNRTLQWLRREDAPTHQLPWRECSDVLQQWQS